MDQYRSRPKLSENFERHWSIQISGEIHMDQSLVHTFSWGNSYGPMVLKVLQKFPPTLVLVHGWLFPAKTDPVRFTYFCCKLCERMTENSFGRIIFSGFRKRGRWNGVASDFSVLFPFFPSVFAFCLSVVFLFFRFAHLKKGETPFARPLLQNPNFPFFWEAFKRSSEERLLKDKFA